MKRCALQVLQLGKIIVSHFNNESCKLACEAIVHDTVNAWTDQTGPQPSDQCIGISFMRKDNFMRRKAKKENFL